MDIKKQHNSTRLNIRSAESNLKFLKKLADIEAKLIEWNEYKPPCRRTIVEHPDTCIYATRDFKWWYHRIFKNQRNNAERSLAGNLIT